MATLFSDGGGQIGSEAAGACIIELDGGVKRFRAVAYLGGATNNESEITAGLLGFSAFRLFTRDDSKIKWVSDSEYVLKSATQYIKNWQVNGWKTASKSPVKNLGLWQAYLHLSQKYSVMGQHVRGHSGHPENEACDRACNWAKIAAPEILAENPEGGFHHISGTCETGKWLVLDGRPFIAAMRSGVSAVDDFELLEKALVNSGVLENDAARVAQAENPQKRAKNAGVGNRAELTSVLALVKKAKLLAARSAVEDPVMISLHEELEELLKSYCND